MEDEISIAEKYLILLLGVEDKPIPSELYLQKEIFVLSQFRPKIQSIFNFQKHYKGPYSQLISEIVDAPIYHPGAFEKINEKIVITKNGKNQYREILEEYSKNNEFNTLISSLIFIRRLYEKLDQEQLLFLIYTSYPNYIEFSNISDKLLKDNQVRLRISRELFQKGIITEERFLELKDDQK
ncbi:hypothetical protein HYV81_00220 [Candidatus Woesearchaeota archaeon]|nr:hypothetical protein [Candidatus Woesearchaeota archaeon]